MPYLPLMTSESSYEFTKRDSAMPTDNRVLSAPPAAFEPDVADAVRQLQRDLPGVPFLVEVNERGHRRITVYFQQAR